MIDSCPNQDLVGFGLVLAKLSQATCLVLLMETPDSPLEHDEPYWHDEIGAFLLTHRRGEQSKGKQTATRAVYRNTRLGTRRGILISMKSHPGTARDSYEA